MKTPQIITIIMIALVISIPFTFAAEISLTYDANGNLVTGDGYYREYNNLNQLYKIYNGSTNTLLLEEYTYHPIEERVWLKKTYNNSGILIETAYYWNQNFQTIVNLSGEYNITYVYIDGQLVARNVNGVKTFFANDAEGSVVATLNSTGGVLEQNSYTPYGKISGGNLTKYEYEAKETDATGLIDFNFRFYNPQTALFSIPDPLIKNMFMPQNLNRYMFELANPYRYTDPTGHEIAGIQILGGEAAFGTGGGESGGYFVDIYEDHLDVYKYETLTWGVGSGASISTELIYGSKTTASDFGGKGYTIQGGVVGPQGLGAGGSGSINIPAEKNGQPKVDKTYYTGGVGGSLAPGGIQYYAGITDTKTTKITTLKIGTSGQSKSSQSNLASTSNTGNKASPGAIKANTPPKKQSGFNIFINNFKSIFGIGKKK